MQRTTLAAWRVVTGLLLAILLMVTGCAKDGKMQGVQEQPTVVQTLVNAQQQDGEAVFTAMGSSVTSGVGVSKSMQDHWTALLVKDLIATKGLDKLDFHNNGYPGITTSKMLSEGRVEEVIKQKPDVVLFETCLLNDYFYKVPLDKTITNLDEIMDKFHKELPQTRVILQSPNPRDPSDANGLGFTYQDYLNKTKEHIESKGWEYIDVYSDFERQRKAEGLQLVDVVPEGVHPNAKGYKYWYNTVKAYFTTTH